MTGRPFGTTRARLSQVQAAGKLADLEAYRAAYAEIIRGLKEVQ